MFSSLPRGSLGQAVNKDSVRDLLNKLLSPEYENVEDMQFTVNIIACDSGIEPSCQPIDGLTSEKAFSSFTPPPYFHGSESLATALTTIFGSSCAHNYLTSIDISLTLTSVIVYNRKHGKQICDHFVLKYTPADSVESLRTSIESIILA